MRTMKGFGGWLTVVAAALMAPALAVASEAPPSDAQIASSSAQIIRNAHTDEAAAEIANDASATLEEARERWADVLSEVKGTTGQAVKDSLEMFGAEGQAMLEATGEAAEYGVEAPLRYRIFVSQAMPREELRQLVELARDRQDLVLVFRGMNRDQKISDVFGFIVSLMGGIKEGEIVPNVAIDPEPFREIGTTLVPTLARYGDDEKLIAHVSGVTSLPWIDEEVSRGQKGNLGQRGSVVEASEEDMIEAMKAVASQLNTDGAGERAVNNYFKKLHQEIATVAFARVRELDPSFVVEETIELPDGKILVEAGTVINPLAEIPFTSILVAFSPTDPRQVEIARAQIAKYEGKNVMLLATSLSHTGGLEGYGALVESLGRHVYYLTQEVRDRFDIQAVPAVVTANGLKFRIEEIPPR